MHRVLASLALLIFLLSNVCVADEKAESGLSPQLLSSELGDKRMPGNFKLAFKIPKAVNSTVGELFASNFEVYVIPIGIPDSLGVSSKYRCRGIMFWENEGTAFLDVRRPPRQESAGKYNVLVRCISGKTLLAWGRTEKRVNYSPGGIDVVLVIDNSQSMWRSDPKSKRIEAAATFIKLASRDGGIKSVGVVAFNNEAKIIAPLTPLSSAGRLVSAIRRLRVDGQTNIDRAMRAAEKVLISGNSKRSAIVFLTDGRNEPGRYRGGHRTFIDKRVPIYAIGLSKKADHRLLEQMAADTGGGAYSAASSNELMGIYMQVASAIQKRTLLLSKAVYGTGSARRFAIPIDRTISSVSFAIDSGAAKLSLTDPSGAVVTPGTNSVSAHGDKSFSVIKVGNPTPGEWIISVTTTKSGRMHRLAVEAETKMFAELFPMQMSGRKVRMGVTLASGMQPVLGARMRYMPLENVGLAPVDLFDDGKHHDGLAGDGVYSGEFQVSAQTEGDLKVSLLTWGSNAVGDKFIRQVEGGIEGVRKLSLKEAKRLSTRLIAGKINLGKWLPEDVASGSTRLTLVAPSVCSLKLHFTGLTSDNGDFLPMKNATFYLPNSRLLSPGQTDLRLDYLVPEGTKPGEYTGGLACIVDGIRNEIPVNLTVTKLAINIKETKMDFGSIAPGKELMRRIVVKLDAPRDLLVSIDPDKSIASLIKKRDIKLRAGCESYIDLKLKAPKGIASGKHSGKVRIKCGPVVKEIQISFDVKSPPEAFVPPILKDDTLADRLMNKQGLLVIKKPQVPVKKEELPPVKAEVKPVAKILPAENNLGKQNSSEIIKKIIVPQVADAPRKKIEASKVENDKLPVQQVSAANSSGWSRWKLIALTLVSVILIAIALMFLRSLVKHRMARFALLSAALHMPLVFFAVCYLIAAKTPEFKKQKPMIARLVKVEKTGDDVSANEKPVTVSSKKNEDGKRFREKTADAKSAEAKRSESRMQISFAEIQVNRKHEMKASKVGSMSRPISRMPRRRESMRQMPDAPQVIAQTPKSIQENTPEIQETKLAKREELKRSNVTKVEFNYVSSKAEDVQVASVKVNHRSTASHSIKRDAQHSRRSFESPDAPDEVAPPVFEEKIVKNTSAQTYEQDERFEAVVSASNASRPAGNVRYSSSSKGIMVSTPLDIERVKVSPEGRPMVANRRAQAMPQEDARLVPPGSISKVAVSSNPESKVFEEKSVKLTRPESTSISKPFVVNGSATAKPEDLSQSIKRVLSGDIHAAVSNRMKRTRQMPVRSQAIPKVEEMMIAQSDVKINVQMKKNQRAPVMTEMLTGLRSIENAPGSRPEMLARFTRESPLASVNPELRVQTVNDSFRIRRNRHGRLSAAMHTPDIIDPVVKKVKLAAVSRLSGSSRSARRFDGHMKKSLAASPPRFSVKAKESLFESDIPEVFIKREMQSVVARKDNKRKSQISRNYSSIRAEAVKPEIARSNLPREITKPTKRIYNRQIVSRELIDEDVEFVRSRGERTSFGKAGFDKEISIAAIRRSLPSVDLPQTLRSEFEEEGKGRLGTSVAMKCFSLVIGVYNTGPASRLTKAGTDILTKECSKRFAGGMKVETRNIDLSEAGLADCQVLVLNGSGELDISESQARALASYFSDGGSIWINDISAEGDERFDVSMRRIINECTGARFGKLSSTHKIFKSLYNLRSGYLGKKIPDGRVSRHKYIEGIDRDGQLSALYMRNDYVGALASASLSSTQREGALRMALNAISCFMGGYRADKVEDSNARRSYVWQDFTGVAQDALIWSSERWGNDANIMLAPDGDGGEAMRVDIAAGKQSKSAIKYVVPAREGRRLNISSASAMSLDLYNSSKESFYFSIVLTTLCEDGKWRDFEAEGKLIDPGWNRNVKFKLSGAKFRTRETGWKKHDTPLRGRKDCGKIGFFFYNGARISASVLIDNLSWVS